MIRAGAGDDGIYGLARVAGRPYRRVHDQVYRLAAEGLVRVEEGLRGRRACVRVAPVDGEPPLVFNRAWSRPSGGLPAETVIAQVLARPVFRDLLACVRHYGSDRVWRAYQAMLSEHELRPGAAEADRRMLTNIEVGRARAAKAH